MVPCTFQDSLYKFQEDICFERIVVALKTTILIISLPFYNSDLVKSYGRGEERRKCHSGP